MASNRIYEMMRAQAREMGHVVADLPSDVWEQCIDYKDRQSSLIAAKLYVKNYMMGQIDPADFAQILAGDDNLRHTVSDLCRMRLDPPPMDIQRSNAVLDVRAAAKTFWSEMKVPLPSEVDAAKDIRNIMTGVAAGKAAAKEQQTTASAQQNQPEIIKTPLSGLVKESLSERLRGLRKGADHLRQNVVEKAVEALTPYAKPAEKTRFADKSWLQTEAGEAYRNSLTRNKAQDLENMAMNVEAGLDKRLSTENRRQAFKAAGMSEEAAEEAIKKEAAPASVMESGYTPEELEMPIDDQMQKLFDQIEAHMGRSQKQYAKAVKEPERAEQQQVQKPAEQPAQKQTEQKQIERQAQYAKGEFNGRQIAIKKSWGGHEFTDDELTKLFAGEEIAFSYTTKKGQEKVITGQLAEQEISKGQNQGRSFIGFKPDYSKQRDVAVAEKLVETLKPEARVGISEDEYYRQLAAAAADFDNGQEVPDDRSYDEKAVAAALTAYTDETAEQAEYEEPAFDYQAYI